MSARPAANSKSFRARYGPWALVAGASEGLGAEFARQLAQRGLHLILIARREKELTGLSGRLRKRFAVEVRALVFDLEEGNLTDFLQRTISDTNVGLMVYNAAFSTIAPFLQASVAQHQKVLDVNCRAPVTMVHYFGEKLVARGHGGIILMSSVSAFQGAPYLATYAASKAFNLHLGEALAFELQPHGIDVLVSCAGATHTPNYVKSQPQASGFFQPPVLSPETVVRETLQALGKKEVVIPGRMNRFNRFIMSRLLSRKLAVRLFGKTMLKLYSPFGGR